MRRHRQWQWVVLSVSKVMAGIPIVKILHSFAESRYDKAILLYGFKSLFYGQQKSLSSPTDRSKARYSSRVG